MKVRSWIIRLPEPAFRASARMHGPRFMFSRPEVPMTTRPFTIPATDFPAEAAVSRRRLGALVAASRGTWARLAVAGALAFGAEAAVWAGARETSALVVAMALASIALGGLTTLRKGLTALRTFTLNIHLLMSTAVFGAAALGKWPEAAVVVFLFAVAELIEAYSLERARRAVRSLMT